MVIREEKEQIDTYTNAYFMYFEISGIENALINTLI